MGAFHGRPITTQKTIRKNLVHYHKKTEQEILHLNNAKLTNLCTSNFSTRGFIHNKLRNALSAQKVDKLLYIKVNYNYKREYEEEELDEQEALPKNPPSSHRLHYARDPQGDPRVKNLLDTKGFRRTVEHQASVEIGIQGGSLDWTNAVLDPPVTSEEIRMEEWKRLAGTQQPQVTIALKSLQPGETSPDPMLLQPGEESSATPDPMSTEPEVAREPTIADVMAIITHLRGEHESLRGEHERLRGEHSCELARLRRKHSCEFDKLNKKLSESNDEAANAYRKHSAEIEELQKTIATQSRCMNALMPRTLHIIHRKLLEWYRGKLFDQVGRLKGDTTKDLIARVRNKIPTELNLWVLERFSTLSKQFHSHPTEKEARIVLESNLDCKDKNYRKIFTVLFPEANALKDRGSNSTE